MVVGIPLNPSQSQKPHQCPVWFLAAWYWTGRIQRGKPPIPEASNQQIPPSLCHIPGRNKVSIRSWPLCEAWQKFCDGGRGAFHITQAVREVQRGFREESDFTLTWAVGANRTETLPDVSHTADISLSPRMAGQIAGISPLMTSFCFSSRCLSTASIKYNRPPPRQPTLAVQEDVFV